MFRGFEVCRKRIAPFGESPQIDVRCAEFALSQEMNYRAPHIIIFSVYDRKMNDPAIVGVSALVTTGLLLLLLCLSFVCSSRVRKKCCNFSNFRSEPQNYPLLAQNLHDSLDLRRRLKDRQINDSTRLPTSDFPEIVQRSASVSSSRRSSYAVTEIPAIEGTNSNLGYLHFVLTIDGDANEMQVDVIQAGSLEPLKIPNECLNLFVEIRLLPDTENQLFTRVDYNTTHPQWMEGFVFEGLSLEGFRKRSLAFILHSCSIEDKELGSPRGVIIYPLMSIDDYAETEHMKSVCKYFQPLPPLGFQ